MQAWVQKFVYTGYGAIFVELCGCFVVVVPYYYAFGNVSLADAGLINPEIINVTTLVEQTKKYASDGLIDATRNMLNDRVFIYNSANDTLTKPGHTLLFASDMSCLLLCRKQESKGARPWTSSQRTWNLFCFHEHSNCCVFECVLCVLCLYFRVRRHRYVFVSFTTP